MERVSVIKIGGNIVDNPQMLSQFAKEFSALEGKCVLVHGGGVMASKVSRSLGIEPQMIGGRRVTDDDTLKVVTAVYAGLCNKTVVALLQKNECNAIGLAGCDGNVIAATMRPKEPIDYGFVGDVDPSKINTAVLDMLLSGGIRPVMCAITHDGQGNLLNTNADTIASSVAIALALTGKYEVDLVYCFEKNGVLLDKDDDDSIIPVIDRDTYASLLAEKKVDGGMIPKLDTAFKALDSGVSRVIIKHALNLGKHIETVIK